jgi:hypothetical protein
VRKKKPSDDRTRSGEQFTHPPGQFLPELVDKLTDVRSVASLEETDRSVSGPLELLFYLGMNLTIKLIGRSWMIGFVA